jgi:hypothetical protein
MGIGDLVRSADWYGDGRGGDFKKVVGEQIGTIVEIDQNPDYPIQYSVLWSDSKITIGDVEEFEVINESR